MRKTRERGREKDRDARRRERGGSRFHFWVCFFRVSFFFSGNFVFFSENGAWEFGDEGGGRGGNGSGQRWVGLKDGLELCFGLDLIDKVGLGRVKIEGIWAWVRNHKGVGNLGRNWERRGVGRRILERRPTCGLAHQKGNGLG